MEDKKNKKRKDRDRQKKREKNGDTKKIRRQDKLRTYMSIPIK